MLSAVHADVKNRGSCVLWATHWVEETAHADKIMVLHQGEKIAEGSPAEVTLALGQASLEQGFIARTSGVPRASQ
jgi:ABC-2 type transport system ATP-binding protein